MKFGYKVKFNGVYYDAGADVPVSDKPVKDDTKVEVKTETKEPSVRDEIEGTNNIMKLRKIAKDNGIEFENNISVADLKSKLFAELNL